MANIDLNLKSEPVGQHKIRVSWVDAKIQEKTPQTTAVVYGVGLGGFVLSAVITMSGAPIVILVWLVTVGVLMFSYSRRVPLSNMVEFGCEITTHGGHRFNTNEITRIEYGSEGQMTGGTKRKLANGADAPDQTMIRLWLNDSAPHVVSVNNWDNGVNHEIRDTLAKALDTVRKDQAKQNHEATHGKTSDFGMPDF